MKKRSVNPIWHEELTLTVADPSQTLKLVSGHSNCFLPPSSPPTFARPDCDCCCTQEVFDKDTFSRDDPMGDAEVDVAPLMEAAATTSPGDLKSGAVVRSVRPSTRNCLADESHVCWRNGRFVQDMILRLKNVESGEVQLQLQWVPIPAAGGGGGGGRQGT